MIRWPNLHSYLNEYVHKISFLAIYNSMNTYIQQNVENKKPNQHVKYQKKGKVLNETPTDI